MNKYILIAKNVIPMLTNVGATSVVSAAIAKVIPANVGKIAKALYILGGIGIGAAVGNAAEKAMSEMIDETLEYFNKSKIEEIKEVEI